MDVTIDHELRFVPPPHLVAALKPRVTWTNPERDLMARSGRPFSYLPEEWSALSLEGPQAHLPRGLLPQLREAAQDAGVPVNWVSRVTWDPAARTVPLDALSMSLRDYQREAVQRAVAGRQGVITLPCGGGKTCVGSTIAIHLGQRAVVVCPSVDIAEQWASTIYRLRPQAHVRLIHGGVDWSDLPLALGEIAVGVDDSLASPRARRILTGAGLLITDETHRIASKTWRAIVVQCAARWRIGLTATPERADGWDMLLTCLLGPVLLERSQRWLVEQGYLAQPTIYPVSTGMEAKQSDFLVKAVCPRCGKGIDVDESKVRMGLMRCARVVTQHRRRVPCGGAIPPDADILKQFSVGRAGSRVSFDPDRLDMVVQVCRWAVERDRDVLVLVPRVAVVPKLVKALKAHGVAAVGLTGSESRSARATALSDLRHRRHRVLIATQLADEGLDLPRMDTLVHTSAGKAAGNAAQRVGRVCRPEGNPPLVFDFVDGGEQYLRQWRARSLAYRKAYGEAAVVERKPIPLSEVLGRCESKGATAGLFG